MKHDVMSVADLLAASRKAHEAYRLAAGRIDKHGTAHPGDEAMCVDAVSTAYSIRSQAHEDDPKHEDPAWALDKVPHDSLMAFYQTYLG